MQRAPARPHVVAVANAAEATSLRSLFAEPVLKDVEVEIVSDDRISRDRSSDLVGGSNQIVLIGSDVPSPLALARAIRREHQGISILFLMDSDRYETFARMLPFVPELRGAVAILKTADAAELRRLVFAAFTAALRRSEASLVRDHIHRRLTEGSSADAVHRQSLLSQSYLATLLTSAPDAIFASDPDGNLLAWNEATAALFGSRFDDNTLGQRVSLLFPDDLQPDIDRLLKRVSSGEVVRQYETRIRRADRSLLDVELSLAPVYAEAKQLAGISFTARDITARKRAEHRQRLLINELNHRVKNTLATVQSLARQTMRSSPSQESFQTDFSDRLMALSRTHDLLTQTSWEGAYLRDVLDTELSPYGGDSPRRYKLLGPDLYLPSQVVLALGMVGHELATNAAKYGALSRGGHVTVSWTASPSALRLEWIERGGPPVKAPARKGFGSRLIERSITGDLGGKVTIDFNPEGLRCVIDLPLDRIPDGYAHPAV